MLIFNIDAFQKDSDSRLGKFAFFFLFTQYYLTMNTFTSSLSFFFLLLLLFTVNILP